MLLFIVPTFAELFTDLGGELPAPTQLLVTMSEFLKVAIVPIVILLDRLVHRRGAGSRTRTGAREFVDPIKLKLPVFGALFQKIALARFSRNLGTMLHVRRADPAGARHRGRHLGQHGASRRPCTTSGERAQR